MGNGPLQRAFSKIKVIFSIIQVATSSRGMAAPNLHSDSKHLCGTIQHEFNGDTGKQKRMGLPHLTSFVTARPTCWKPGFGCPCPRRSGLLLAARQEGCCLRTRALMKLTGCALLSTGHKSNGQAAFQLAVTTTSGNSWLHCLGGKNAPNTLLIKRKTQCLCHGVGQAFCPHPA